MKILVKTLVLIYKILLGLLAVVLTASIGYMYLFRFQQYTTENVNWVDKAAMVLTQPLVDILGNSKISRPSTWTKDTQGLSTVSEDKRVLLSFPSSWSENRYFFSPYTNDSHAAVLKPKIVGTGAWKIAYCELINKQITHCYQSQLVRAGEQALQRPGENQYEVFGVDANNTVVELTSAEYLQPAQLGSVPLL